MVEKNFIFDFDGTIADTFDILYKKIQSEVPLFAFSKEQIKQMTLTQLLKVLGVPLLDLPRVLLRIHKEMRTELTHAKAFDGISALLQDLHTQNHKIFIVSSNSVENIEFFLEKNGLRSFFSGVYSELNVFGKARKLEKLILRHKLFKAHTYYIGDETRDIEASRKAGISSIAVAWGYNSQDLLKASDPDFMVDHPREFFKLLL